MSKKRKNLLRCSTLLELGASPNYRDARGLTPLYLSVIRKTDAKICESLLHDHATLGTQDSQGWQEVHQVDLLLLLRLTWFSLKFKTQVNQQIYYLYLYIHKHNAYFK